MKIRFWVVCDEMGEVIKNSPNFKTQKEAYKWIGKNLNPRKYELCLIDWVGERRSRLYGMSHLVLQTINKGRI